MHEEPPLVHGSNVLVGEFLRQLELRTSRAAFARAAGAVVRLLGPRPCANEGLRKRTRTTVVVVGLDVAVTCVRLGEVVGAELVRGALRECVEGGRWVARGMHDGGTCHRCGAGDRLAWSCCLECGAPREGGLAPSMPPPMAASRAVSALERKECLRRGVQYFCSCLKDPQMFRRFGGDMIFLAVKAWFALRGHGDLEVMAKEATLEAMMRWKKDVAGKLHNRDSSDKLDMAVLLDSMECLHGIAFAAKALQEAGDEDTAKALLAPVMQQQQLQPHQATTEGHPPPHQAQPSTRSSRQQQLSGATTTTAAAADPTHTTPPTILSEIKTLISDLLWSFDLTDATGFDPADCASSGPPMTPITHCSNCGEEENEKDSKECVRCSHQLECRLDFGAMTDAWVWAFVFGTVNMKLSCQSHNARTTLRVEDLLANDLLTTFRKYLSLSELGGDFWKLQCYWASHFVYVQSNWGSCALRRELYMPEFNLFSTSLMQALILRDPELVGEFLHCLRILEYRPGQPGFAGLDAAVRQAVCFLVEVERRLGRKGMFMGEQRTTYDKYHAAWTGIVGLLDHDEFGLGGVGTVKEPIPCWPGLAETKPGFLLWP